MKFKTNAVVAGNPEFEARLSSSPIGVQANVEGSMELRVGRLDCRVDEIPIKLAIPFLHRSVQMVGSVGAFGIHVKPFDVSVAGFGVRADGTLGTKGMNCDLDGKVRCRMEMDLSGVVPGRVTKAAIELAGHEDEEDTED